MTDRAHLYRVITDTEGNVRSGASVTVTVYQPGTTTVIAETLYADNTSSTTLANPFVTATGAVDFYLAAPRRVDLKVDDGTRSVVYHDVDVVDVAPNSSGLSLSATTVYANIRCNVSWTGQGFTDIGSTPSAFTYDAPGPITYTNDATTINIVTNGSTGALSFSVLKPGLYGARVQLFDGLHTLLPLGGIADAGMGGDLTPFGNGGVSTTMMGHHDTSALGAEFWTGTIVVPIPTANIPYTGFAPVLRAASNDAGSAGAIFEVWLIAS